MAGFSFPKAAACYGRMESKNDAMELTTGGCYQTVQLHINHVSSPIPVTPF